MKKIFRQILILFVIILSLWSIYGCYKWSACGCSDKTYRFTDDEKSMIALFSADKKTLRKIFIQRFKIEEPYKYPFFYPQYFSDFYILDLEAFDSLVFVMDTKDTLLAGTMKQLNSVPSEIKVYNSAMAQIATYRPDTIYLDNIKCKPTISIFKQLVLFGPSMEECLDKCD